MSPKTSSNTVSQVSDPLPGSPDADLIPLGDVRIDETLEPIILKDTLIAAGLLLNQVPAAELDGQTFIIYGMRAFQSSFQGQDHCYYCACKQPESGVRFATVLGGQAVVNMLDMFVRAGLSQPIQVTLKNVQGGQFGHYYVLE